MSYIKYQLKKKKEAVGIYNNDLSYQMELQSAKQCSNYVQFL